jgi:hypothetical protein
MKKGMASLTLQPLCKGLLTCQFKVSPRPYSCDSTLIFAPKVIGTGSRGELTSLSCSC